MKFDFANAHEKRLKIKCNRREVNEKELTTARYTCSLIPSDKSVSCLVPFAGRLWLRRAGLFNCNGAFFPSSRSRDVFHRSLLFLVLNGLRVRSLHIRMRGRDLDLTIHDIYLVAIGQTGSILVPSLNGNFTILLELRDKGFGKDAAILVPEFHSCLLAPDGRQSLGGDIGGWVLYLRSGFLDLFLRLMLRRGLLSRRLLDKRGLHWGSLDVGSLHGRRLLLGCWHGSGLAHILGNVMVELMHPCQSLRCDAPRISVAEVLSMLEDLRRCGRCCSQSPRSPKASLSCRRPASRGCRRRAESRA